MINLKTGKELAPSGRAVATDAGGVDRVIDRCALLAVFGDLVND